MPKIMQINITCGIGSTGRLSQMLYETSIKNGYEARFAYSAFEPKIANAFPIENKFQNYLRRGLNKFFGSKHLHSKPGTRRLIRYIKKESPDLIHLHNIQQNSTDYRLLFEFLKHSNIPVVYTLHDCWSFTGGCYHFTAAGCTKYRDGCVNCPKNHKLDDVTLDSSSQYNAKSELISKNDNIRIICVSNWLRNVAETSYMGKMYHPPQTIHNGIDCSVFFPHNPAKFREKYNLKDTFLILGVSSYWTEEKGIRIFSDLADRLQAPYKICLVGTCDSKLLDDDDRFILIKRTDNIEQLSEIYSAADVFVNASIEETFGLTTAEALACGTPAIVFNSTACPEVVDSKSGIVCEIGVEPLARAVDEIRIRGKSTYSSACVERIRNNFTKEIMLNKYFELYYKLICEQRDGEKQ